MGSMRRRMCAKRYPSCSQLRSSADLEKDPDSSALLSATCCGTCKRTGKGPTQGSSMCHRLRCSLQTSLELHCQARACCCKTMSAQLGRT